MKYYNKKDFILKSFYLIPRIHRINENTKNTKIFIVTMLAPVGVDKIKEQKIPAKTHVTETIAEQMTTP